MKPEIYFVSFLLVLAVASRAAAEPAMVPDIANMRKSAAQANAKTDASICEIMAPDIVAPTSLPPFPDRLSLGVELESKEPSPALLLNGNPSKCLIEEKATGAGTKPLVASKLNLTALQESQEGLRLGSLGKLPEAVPYHHRALAMDKTNVALRTNYATAEVRLADQLLKANKVEQAEKHYRRAIFLDSTNLAANEHLNGCIKAQGKDPKDKHTRLTLAAVANNTGDVEGAVVESFMVATMDNTKDGRAFFGMCLQRANMLVEAFDQLAFVVADGVPNDASQDLRGNRAECHVLLGNILARVADLARDTGRKEIYLKRLQSAWIEYRRALYLNPERADLIKPLCTISKRAIDLYNQSFDNQLAYGSAMLLAGDTRIAKSCYDRCEQINPKDERLSAAKEALSARNLVK